MEPQEIYLEIGIRIHLRLWNPHPSRLDQPLSYLLLHGLSSNASTWDRVAASLADAGHQVAAVDQRGHGLSDKPETGYDFPSMIRDLQDVLKELGWKRPIMAGQSWGGNVLLEYAASHPGNAAGFIFVDGGFINLKERGLWEQIAIELRPPDLVGTPRAKLAERIRQAHPSWSEEGIQATLGNFEVLADRTVRPWLTLDRHMRILRAMYDQDPQALYPQVKEPALICAADDGGERMAFKRAQVQAAAANLPQAEAHWFLNSAHDIHVDQPEQLAEAMLAFGQELPQGN